MNQKLAFNPFTKKLDYNGLLSLVDTANTIVGYDGSGNLVLIPTGSIGGGITVVANYSALPAASTVSGKFYWCSNSQGTYWLPNSLGGTFYNSGLYYSNGTTWEFLNVPYQATQSAVNAETITNQFVTPSTLGGWFNQKLFALTAKTTPVDADTITGTDSASSNSPIKITWANIKATLKTYFDTIYTTTSAVAAQITAAISGKADINSPAFTGTPTSPTPTTGDNSTKIATTAFVNTIVANSTPNVDDTMSQIYANANFT